MVITQVDSTCDGEVKDEVVGLAAEVVDPGLGQVGADHHGEGHLNQIVRGLFGLGGLEVNGDVHAAAAGRTTLRQNLQKIMAKTHMTQCQKNQRRLLTFRKKSIKRLHT